MSKVTSIRPAAAESPRRDPLASQTALMQARAIIDLVQCAASQGHVECEGAEDNSIGAALAAALDLLDQAHKAIFPDEQEARHE